MCQSFQGLGIMVLERRIERWVDCRKLELQIERWVQFSKVREFAGNVCYVELGMYLTFVIDFIVWLPTNFFRIIYFRIFVSPLIHFIFVYQSFALRVYVRLGVYNVNVNCSSASQTVTYLMRNIFFSLKISSFRFLQPIFWPF